MHKLKNLKIKKKGTSALNSSGEANKNSFTETFGAKSGYILGIAK